MGVGAGSRRAARARGAGGWEQRLLQGYEHSGPRSCDWSRALLHAGSFEAQHHLLEQPLPECAHKWHARRWQLTGEWLAPRWVAAFTCRASSSCGRSCVQVASGPIARAMTGSLIAHSMRAWCDPSGSMRFAWTYFMPITAGSSSIWPRRQALHAFHTPLPRLRLLLASPLLTFGLGSGRKS
jgi:hypothetical protein